MPITDNNRKSHRVVAIGRIFKDYEEITLKVKEMYPFVDMIYLAEGRTGDNIFEEKDHDNSTIKKIPDPDNKIMIIKPPHKGPWKSNLESMQALWGYCAEWDIVYIMGADEYMSKYTWMAVLDEFRAGATRVNLPLFDLWHDFNWRSNSPFLYHERFVLRHPRMDFVKHFQLGPDNLKDYKMVHLHEKFPRMDFAIYHTCWTKNPQHLIKRSLRYIIRDLGIDKLDLADQIQSKNFLGTFNDYSIHTPISKYLSGSTKGYHQFSRSELPEILLEHSKYNYTWESNTKLDISDFLPDILNILENKKPMVKIMPQVKKEPKKEGLNILILAFDNFANVPYLYNEYLNKIPGVTSQFIQETKSYIDYPTGIMYRDNNQVLRAVQWADVVIFNSNEKMEFHYFDLKPHLRGKKVIGLWHGSWLRLNPQLIKSFYSNTNSGNVVVTPDLLAKMPYATCIPNPVTVDIMPENKTEYISISHAPTNRVKKGTQKIIEAVDRLKNEGYDIKFILIERTNHTNCLKNISRAWIHISQLTWGVYGVSAVEGVLLGCLTIAGVGNTTWDSSLVDANETNLYDVLKSICDMPKEKIQEWNKKQLTCIKNIHSPEIATEKLLNVIKSTPVYQ